MRQLNQNHRISKILLLEDDPILAKSLAFNLRAEGLDLDWFQTIESAGDALHREEFDLLLLDVELPDGLGTEFCRRLRERGYKQPVVFISARDSEESTLEGFDAGANDYVRKPFSIREVVVRVQTHLRGASAGKTVVAVSDDLEIGGLRLSLKERRVTCDGTDLHLNRTKFDILYFLCKNRDRVVSRDSLLLFLGKEGEVFDRTIDAHLSQIRRCLKNNGIEHVKIVSIYGVGYRLETTSRASERR